MATKLLTLDLKPEEVDEVIKKVQNLTEDVEVYIQLTKSKIKELLGTDISDEDLNKFLDKIIDIDRDAITDYPRTQNPIIKPPTEDLRRNQQM